MPKGYSKARVEFQARAQDWQRSRPGRLVRLPEDLLAIAKLGIPCQTCGSLIYRAGAGTDRHAIGWAPTDGGHWAGGITATCA